MLGTFIKEYKEWKKEHRMEVQQAILKKQMAKTPLNYALLEQIFRVWVENSRPDTVMTIKGNDFTLELRSDVNGAVTKITRTEEILNRYE